VNIEKMQARLADFAKERDWEQFHSPKNLSMALSGRALALRWNDGIVCLRFT